MTHVCQNLQSVWEVNWWILSHNNRSHIKYVEFWASGLRNPWDSNSHNVVLLSTIQQESANATRFEKSLVIFARVRKYVQANVGNACKFCKHKTTCRRWYSYMSNKLDCYFKYTGKYSPLNIFNFAILQNIQSQWIQFDFWFWIILLVFRLVVAGLIVPNVMSFSFNMKLMYISYMFKHPDCIEWK